MKQNQYNYTRKVGRITYSIVVREAEEAKEKVDNRIKKLLLNDLSKAAFGSRDMPRVRTEWKGDNTDI